MGLGRLVVIGIVIWLCLRWWWRRDGGNAATPAARQGGRAVACDICGVFVPEREAFRSDGGKHRCSLHRDDRTG